MANPYTPEGALETNPIGCVSSWLGSLIRPPSPAYVHAPVEPPGIAVAHVRGVIVERVPVFQADGTPLDDSAGPVAGITLVVDDDTAATTVLDAIRDGTPIRVLSGRCK